MRKILLLLILITSMGLNGCGNSFRQTVDPMAINSSTSVNEATIVFLRPRTWGVVTGEGVVLTVATLMLGPVAWGFRSSSSDEVYVLEVEQSEKLKFITLLPVRGKLLHKTTPGTHLYFAGESFLEADLEAGKTYYAYVIMRSGFRPHFVLAPVTTSDLSSENFQKAFAECEWFENTPFAHTHFNKHAQADIERFVFGKFREYSTVKPEDKMLMLPEYGTETPIR